MPVLAAVSVLAAKLLGSPDDKLRKENTVTDLLIGIMSGTSADAADAVLLRFPDEGGLTLLASHSLPWPDALRTEILALGNGGADEIERAGRLDRQLAHHYAKLVQELLATAGVPASAIRAIGCHGQTVRHRPQADWPFTLQLGDAHTLAELTGISVVSDFRRRDIAAGGQGAPLVPAFHQGLFAQTDRTVAVLNLGGIANLSLLQPGEPPLGFDTGPANMLMDGWCERHTGQRYDEDGRWAASGTPLPDLLSRLLQHPYLGKRGPRSTGREEFGMDWLDALLASMAPGFAPADVQATLAAFTIDTVAQALLREADQGALVVCGGGALNPHLMAGLARRLPTWQVSRSDAHGLHPCWVEASAFAWLARQMLEGLAGNVPAVTGAQGPRVLGAWHPAGPGLRLP